MRWTDETKKELEAIRARWSGSFRMSQCGADVHTVLELLDVLARNVETLQEQERDARWHLKQAREALETATEKGREEERAWRFQNGVTFSSFPLPGDVCGHNRCVGILRAGTSPYYVQCEKCRVRFGPGPGAAEALEAAEHYGRTKALEELRNGAQDVMRKMTELRDAQAEALPVRDRYIGDDSL